MSRRTLYANAATDKTTGHARPAICAIPLETPWKDVEQDWIKIIGDGTLREHNASVEIGRIAGDATTVTSATARATNANVAIKKKIGDAIIATKITGSG